MTEINDNSDILPPAVQEFVLRWGDLGGQWGVNRSVAQIHALLYLSDRPVTAEHIAERLGMARSNVSNSIKELTGWKLVRRVPVLGDRRDHFEAETDLWLMATRIAQGRKEREVDPMVAAIHAAMAKADDSAIGPVVKKRLAEMDAFVGTVERWYEDMLKVPPNQLMALIRMGGRIVALLKPRGRKAG